MYDTLTNSVIHSSRVNEINLFITKITDEVSICGQATLSMQSDDIFNFVYYYLNNKFLKHSAQENFSPVKENVLSKFQAHLSHCI